jgi:photosystem II stability/assembly factor-like uncharacterized protein
MGDGLIYLSADSGARWVTATAPSNFWVSVASSADGSKLFAASGVDPLRPEVLFGDGLIYSSSDSGVTWRPTSAPTCAWASVACSADGNLVVAGAENRSIYLSHDSGATWVATPTPVNSWDEVLSSADGSRLVAAAGDGFYDSKDFGRTWTFSASPPLRRMAISTDGNKCVAASGRTLILSPYGGPWRAATTPQPSSWISVACSTDANLLVACQDYTQRGEERLFRSTDSGTTWAAISALSNLWSGVVASADGLHSWRRRSVMTLATGEESMRQRTRVSPGFPQVPRPTGGQRSPVLRTHLSW